MIARAGGLGAALPVSYDWRVVLLSVAIACLAAYTALDLTGPSSHARTRRESLAWVFAGTAALAIGVWSMHFIGMQAFEVPMPLRYNIPIVFASFVVAFGGAMVSLWWLVLGGAKHSVMVGASILLGLCLAGMHYTGMAALSIPAIIGYNPAWVAASVIIAIGTSYAAFRLAALFSKRDDLRRFIPKALTAAVLGIAIVSVHYSGMAGAHFYPAAHTIGMGSTAVVNQHALAIAVSTAAFVILALFLLSAFMNSRAREKGIEQARLRLLADSTPNLIWTLNHQSELEYVNVRFREYTGLSMDECVSSDVRSIVHPDDRTLMTQRWRDAGEGKPYNDELRLRAADGTYRWHAVQALPVCDETGHVVQWVGSSVDIHEQKEAGTMAAFLNLISHALTASTDLPQAMSNVAELTCRWGDHCAIVFEDSDGARRDVSAGTFPEDEDVHHWSRRLENAGHDSGSLTVVRRAGAPGFSALEQRTFEDLASRLAVAIVTSNLHHREHRIAQSFQHASLPADLPHIPSISFDAVYIPGRSEATVGGDWYDALRLMDGRIIISIGDVSGSGLGAAVLMGNMRQIIRGIAQVHADPALMLDAADRALRLEHAERFATAFVGVVDPIARTFTYATAGHPPPMLRRPDGSVEALTDGGLPLGLRNRRELTPGRTTELQPGTTLVLYTDGLTEASRDPEDGERMLRELVVQATVLEQEHPAAAIRYAFLDGNEPHDDVAILVVRFADPITPPSARRWLIDIDDADIASRARREIAAYFHANGASETDVSMAEIVLGELLSNIVRHARGPAEVVLDWSADSPVLHVLDQGRGFQHLAIMPPDLESESGRGLFIASALAQDLRVTRRPGGGSHARAVLSLERRRLHHISRG